MPVVSPISSVNEVATTISLRQFLIGRLDGDVRMSSRVIIRNEIGSTPTILRDRGYIAAVEVPEQRIADGVVRFRVLMARLTQVRVRGNATGAERTIGVDGLLAAACRATSVASRPRKKVARSVSVSAAVSTMTRALIGPHFAARRATRAVAARHAHHL